VSVAAEMKALEKSLSRRFRVVQTPVQVNERELSLLHPASAEDLIDERDFEVDERLPYWAELWPSARVLGEQVLTIRGAGRSLLELGCGSGLVATCASLAGFDVLATDYYEDAPRFARLNAWRNDAPAVRGMLLDWRHLPSGLGPFDFVIGSDVLYERPYGELVAGAIAATLRDDGTAIIADPGRVGREAFLDALAAHGLTVESRVEFPFVEGSIRQRIVLFTVMRTA
jgi:predicted nicotinamide N-methyase